MYVVNQRNNKKLSKVLSTKLSMEDYNAFVMLIKIEYEAGLIKEKSIRITKIYNMSYTKPSNIYSNNSSNNNSFIVKLSYPLLLLINSSSFLRYHEKEM
jgi:hypothetical protein